MKLYCECIIVWVDKINVIELNGLKALIANSASCRTTRLFWWSNKNNINQSKLDQTMSGESLKLISILYCLCITLGTIVTTLQTNRLAQQPLRWDTTEDPSGTSDFKSPSARQRAEWSGARGGVVWRCRVLWSHSNYINRQANYPAFYRQPNSIIIQTYYCTKTTRESEKVPVCMYVCVKNNQYWSVRIRAAIGMCDCFNLMQTLDLIHRFKFVIYSSKDTWGFMCGHVCETGGPRVVLPPRSLKISRRNIWPQCLLLKLTVHFSQGFSFEVVNNLYFDIMVKNTTTSDFHQKSTDNHIKSQTSPESDGTLNYIFSI